MDGTNTLKRRRPHFYDGDSYELHSQNQNSLPFQPDYLSSYAPHEQFILDQAINILQLPHDTYCLHTSDYNSYIIKSAASILQCSPQYLVDSTSCQRLQQVPPKRQRRSLDLTSPSMSQHYTDNASQDPEKTERSVSLGSLSINQHYGLCSLPLAVGGSILVSTASGVVDCLAGLATCQGLVTDGSSSEYEAVLTTSAAAVPTVPSEASHYTGSISHADVDRPGTLVQVGGSYSNGYGAPEVESLFSDNSTESAQYMQSYPVLQPTIAAPTIASPAFPLTRIQPSTHSESMYYPSDQMSSIRPKTEDDGRGEPMAANPAELMPMLAAAFTGPQLPSESTQQSLGDLGYSRGTPSLATASYCHPTMQSVGTTHGGYTPVLVDAAPFSTAAVLPGPSSPSTAVAPHYGLVHMPQLVTQHHHHYVHGQMPIVYMGEPSMSDQSLQRLPAARRGPFKDQTIRQKTAQTRKDGSCIRCRMQRIRCEAVPGNTKGPCECCLKPLSRTWRLPCMRLKINGIVLAKTTQVKGHEWTLRWKENTVLGGLDHWASSEVRTLRVSEGYTGEYVELRVRKFVPQKGDSVSRSWVTADGTRRSVPIPPYAIVDPETISGQYSGYIKRGLIPCCGSVLADLKETLIWATYTKAISLSHTAGLVSQPEQDMLMSVLELWVTVRLTTRSFEIVGTETLDMPADILDETSPSHGKIPIPPVMGAQLDSVLIHQIQHNVRKDALKKLGKVITENRTNTWISIYLAIFVLLHNAALVIKHDASYARKHGIKRRFAREDKVFEYHLGAVTLLAYFHYCNKGVFPFTEAAKETDIRNIANLDDDSMEFVRETRKAVLENKQKWQAMLDNDEYEDDFYFVSQMYEENWQPRPMNI